MRFLNPKTDFAFKRIFGSAESGDILISFLNAILELEAPHRIEAVEIVDPYLAPKIQGMKDTYLDVRVKDGEGRHYLIEMQVLNVQGFEQRILYNACKAYAGQIAKGEDYHLLTDVIALTLTDFVMFDEYPALINKFKMRAEDGTVYANGDLELVFVELPKFQKAEDDLASTMDRWLYFLKHAGDLRAVPKSLGAESAISHAFAIANKAGLTAEELDDQERRLFYMHDQRRLHTAIEDAKTRGEAKGRAEGEAKGRADAMNLALQRLVASGMSEADARRLLAE